MAGEADDFRNIQAESSFDVNLYIYDMTKGMAKTLSTILLGKQLTGIWHTGVVAYDREYFFGSGGIESCEPCGTMLGEPDQILSMGKTEIPYSVFLEYVFAMGESDYKLGTYDLFHHNCNNFSHDVCTFLTGRSVPKEILDLPQEVLNTPIGQTIKSYLDTISIRAEGSRGISFSPNLLQNSAAEQSQRQQQQKRSSPAQQRQSSPSQPVNTRPKMSDSGDHPDSAAAVKPASDPIDDDDDLSPKTFISTRKSKRYDDPAVIFPDIDGVGALQALSDKMDGKLNEDEKVGMKELHEYLTTDCGAWVLGALHLDLIGRLLNDRNFPPEIHLLMLRFLQTAALKDDLILLLHQDRKDHHLMSYIYKIEGLTLDEQEEIVKLLCNFCHNPSSFDWLMYISEWQEDNQPCNNCRVTTRAATHCVLSERTSIQEKGAALMFNLALKELFDDTASELSMAILQYLQSDLKEETAFHCLTAVLRFLNISFTEVPSLVKMLGPDLSKFRGKSDRVNQLIEDINIKVPR